MLIFAGPSPAFPTPRAPLLPPAKRFHIRQYCASVAASRSAFDRAAWTVGCANGNSGSSSHPTTASIQVAVGQCIFNPAGEHTKLQRASPTPRYASRVERSGVPGGNAAVGTISASGVYIAPADCLRRCGAVTARSHADSTKSASANVTITSDIAVVGRRPAAASSSAPRVVSGQCRERGHPDMAIHWSVPARVSGACGTTTPMEYTARRFCRTLRLSRYPKSAADGSKQSSVTVTSPAASHCKYCAANVPPTQTQQSWRAHSGSARIPATF